MTTRSYVQERLAGHGAPRPLVPGEYHVTDHLNTPKVKLIQMYRRVLANEGIDAWDAARGKAVERIFTEKARDGYADVVVRLHVADGVVLEGHIDELWWWSPTTADLIEAVSGPDDWNPATERRKLEQATAYWRMLQEGGRLYRETWPSGERHVGERVLEEVEAPGKIDMIRIVFGGLHSPGEREFRPDQKLGDQVLSFLIEAALLVHSLGVEEPDADLDLALDFDMRHGRPDRSSRIEASADLETDIKEHARLGRLIAALEEKRGLIGQQALLALPPPDAEGKRRVKSEWGTFGDTTRSLGITEHTQRLEDFLKAKNKPLTDFQVVRQVIERDDAALDAWLREQGASLTDYQEARTSEPSVRLWPNGEAKKVLSSLDLATAAAAALGHP